MATWLVSGKVEFEIEREVEADSEEEAIKIVEESIYESYTDGDIEIGGDTTCYFYDGWGHKLSDEGLHEVEGYQVHDAWDV